MSGVGDVDDHRALEVADSLQRLHGIGVASGQDDGVGASRSPGDVDGGGTWVVCGHLGGLGTVACRDADLVARADELTDEGRAMFAGADDSDLHVLCSFEQCSVCCEGLDFRSPSKR